MPLMIACAAWAQDVKSLKNDGFGTVMTPEQVLKELGPATGLQSGEKLYKGKTVNSVSVRYRSAGKTVAEDRLKNMLATRPGTEYDPAVVDKDLERLLQSGLVGGDTSVSVVPSGNGVSVVFEMAAQNLLGGVGFRGNKYFTENDLREECGLTGGVPLSDKALSDALKKLNTYYFESRFPDTKITYEFQRTERAGFVDVIFNIVEGKKANIINIDFVGNDKISSAELREVMKTKEKGWATWFTKSGRIDREVIEDDLAAIVNHYRNKGYLRAKLDKVQYFDSGNEEEQKLSMKITLTEGRRYKVNKVAFTPTKVFTADELVKALSMYDGDSYSAEKVAADVKMIRNYYGSRGYADVDVRPDIQEIGVNPEGFGSINIVYRITEGKPYKVGNIRMTGNHKTKDYVLRQELPLQSNDPLNSVDLETAQKRLENLNYFGMVDVSQTKSTRDGYRDVNIEVEEKRTGSLNFGVSFSSVENVFLFASVTQSNFDLYDWGSFVGGGQRFGVNAKVGAETQQASISWVDPWFLHRKLAFGTEFFYQKSDYYSDYYEQMNYGFAVSLRKPIGEMDYVKLEYRLEKYSIDAEWNAPVFFKEQDGDYIRSHVELSYTVDTRDAQITPRKGGKFEALGGWSGLGGDVNTYNFGINGSYYWNLRGDTIFSINAGVATVDSYGSDNEVPIFERLYLGGMYNLRGFRFRDVAPFNEALSGDETMGGRSSAYCQFEFTVPVVEQVRFAVFYDIGFVNEESFDFDGSKVASDIGIGLRLNLPIGPLAVDYAIPLETGNAIDDGGQFQFYMNYAF